MFTLLAEITCISFAVISGIIAFPYGNRFFKVLFIQVTVWGIFYGISHIITVQQQSHHQPIDNQWLMNIYLILETGLLLAAAWFVLPHFVKKTLIGSSFALFLMIAFIQGWVSGFRTYMNFADVTSCILQTIIFTLTLYTLNQQTNRRFWSSPEKWACLGILLYFACSVPYVSMMHYLQEHNPKMNTFLYYLISNVLGNLRYLLLGVAFVKLYRNKTQLTHTP